MNVWRLHSIEFDYCEDDYYFSSREKALEFEEKYAKFFNISRENFHLDVIAVDRTFEELFMEGMT